MRNTADVTGDKPIAVLLQSISGVSAINPLVTFHDIHEGKREVLFFYFILDTTRDTVESHGVIHNKENIITILKLAFFAKRLSYEISSIYFTLLFYFNDQIK
jgi:hypothetical protein